MVLQVVMYRCERCGRTYENAVQGEQCCSEPKPLGNPPTNQLRDWAARYVRSLRDRKPIKEPEQHAFKRTFEVFYGPRALEWIETQREEIERREAE